MTERAAGRKPTQLRPLRITRDYLPHAEGSALIEMGNTTVVCTATIAGGAPRWLKSNGGGWQVWISHGGGMYTTYNHMSGVAVGTGQGVSRGQRVGRIGASGRATGPHLHFEVWRGGMPWSGGYQTNPMRYF